MRFMLFLSKPGKPRNVLRMIGVLSLSLLIVSCYQEGKLSGMIDPERKLSNFRYLALGDSYTIGTAMASKWAYPRQLADSLSKKMNGQSVDLDIMARGGWTTGDLLGALAQAKPDSGYHLVSLLIGTNNQFQGRPIKEYRAQFRIILEWAVSLADSDSARVFVFSMPDWGVTPVGGVNAGLIAEEINRFNKVNQEISDSMGVAYYNITDISRKAAQNRYYVAKDGLHFSAEMHSLWVHRYLNDIVDQLQAD